MSQTLYHFQGRPYNTRAQVAAAIAEASLERQYNDAYDVAEIFECSSDAELARHAANRFDLDLPPMGDSGAYQFGEPTGFERYDITIRDLEVAFAQLRAE